MEQKIVNAGVDLLIGSSGDLTLSGGGDLGVISGRDCLLQDVSHRLETSPGDLLALGTFGSRLFSFLGTADTELNRGLIRRTVESALREDPRINSGTIKVSLIKYSSEELEIKVSFIPQKENHPLNLIYGLTVSGIELLSK